MILHCSHNCLALHFKENLRSFFHKSKGEKMGILGGIGCYEYHSTTRTGIFLYVLGMLIFKLVGRASSHFLFFGFKCWVWLCAFALNFFGFICTANIFICYPRQLDFITTILVLPFSLLPPEVL